MQAYSPAHSFSHARHGVVSWLAAYLDMVAGGSASHGRGAGVLRRYPSTAMFLTMVLQIEILELNSLETNSWTCVINCVFLFEHVPGP